MSVNNAPTVFITGATSGFGRAAALKFGNKGYSLILTGRRVDRLTELANELSPVCNVHTVALDVRDKTQMDTLLANLPASFSKIEVLINNAGLALGAGPANEASLDDWHTMIDTNITGLVNVTHALLPLLLAQPTATIINLASIASNWCYPGAHVYGASKAFVAQFSRNLRCDFAGTGLRITSLEPGLSESEFSLVRFKGDQDKYDEIYKGTNPLQPIDIAEILLWIAEQPAHININSLEVMPTSQAWNTFKVVRH